MKNKYNIKDETMLSLGEIHIFSYNGNQLAWLVDKSILIQMTTIIFDIINSFDTSLSLKELTKKLYNKYDSIEIYDIVSELIKLNALIDQTELQEKKTINHINFYTNSLTLILTDKCNLNCIYCFENNKNEPEKKESMTLETAKNAIDTLFKYSLKEDPLNILFFGGEPLLKIKTINQLFYYSLDKAYANNKQIHFTITTNGTLLNENNIKFLNKTKMSVLLSIDGGLDEQNFNRPFRNGQTYNKSLEENIAKFVKNRPYPTTARVTCTKNNMILINFIPKLVDMGFKEIQIFPAIKKGIKDLEINIDEFILEYEKLLDTGLVEYINHYQNLKDILENKKYSINFCGALIRQITVRPDGKIYICPVLAGDKSFLIGNVNEQFISNNQIEKIRKGGKFLHNNKSCDLCWARYICRGGCIAERLFLEGNIYNTNQTLCKLTKKIIELNLGYYYRKNS